MADAGRKRPLEAVVPRGLAVESVLMCDPDAKCAFVLCIEPDSGEKAVVTLNKKPWTEADIRSTLEPHNDNEETALEEVHRNDKFSKYAARPPPAANEVAITLICPANEIGELLPWPRSPPPSPQARARRP